ncbi:membrane-bound serine protease (ClpP class) [Hydrogenivirga caldilitoris]|uniref:Membrane-bound serine protease (ClpP class) n=1 Tax=Hydrogenivirga caldilitoris TaxID=246264 RepID=A0A497XRB9_9AQUI|nr:nodulation protein NfeD [Hydrogenivirga caldilitoris]RLJ70639.1 membrane-bound serine protease (ClpP class) [Hydrogenivirga caldilitoris]
MALKIFLSLLLILSFSFSKVFVAKWDGAITPITADFIDRALTKAEKEGGRVFVLQLNTPGGLAESMRKVVQKFQGSHLPVVVFVYPPGGRAASAGAIITVAADIAAMAPGTNIGAAHPVQIGGLPSEDKKEGKGEKDRDIMKEKILQDMLAFVRSIAKEKGRNVKVVERMVKESLSLSAEEALKERVIDLIATDMNDLLNKIEGRKVYKFGREIEVKVRGEEVVYIEESFKEELLKIITNPTVAYILLMLGFYGIFFELYNPGAVIPGVVGAICLLLGLYGLSLISMNWLGLFMIILGILLFVLELITPTFGALALGGVIALALGSLFLIEPESPYGELPKSVITAVVLASALFFLVAGRLGLKAQRRRKLTGAEGMLGEEGEAVTDFERGKGKVLVHGEIWNAESSHDIKKGDAVRVVAVKGLKLIVEKPSSEPPEQRQEL